MYGNNNVDRKAAASELWEMFLENIMTACGDWQYEFMESMENFACAEALTGSNQFEAIANNDNLKSSFIGFIISGIKDSISEMIETAAANALFVNGYRLASPFNDDKNDDIEWQYPKRGGRKKQK